MKTAISIPDGLFSEAEELARALGMSRSELYARAAADYVRRHRQRDVTARLNAVYAKTDSRSDRVLSRLAAASLPREDW